MRNRELVCLLSAVGLSILGILLLSGSEPDYLSGLRLWHKQAIWASLAVALALLVSRVPVEYLIRVALPLYLLNLVALILLFWSGTQKGGATSWFI